MGNARDERLSAWLSAWQGIEPRADFEGAVWRRIRAAAVPKPQGLPRIATLRQWMLPHPAWASAIAATAAIMVGVLVGRFVPAGHESGAHSEPLLHPQTLAGAYLAMARGENR